MTLFIKRSKASSRKTCAKTKTRIVSSERSLNNYDSASNYSRDGTIDGNDRFRRSTVLRLLSLMGMLVFLIWNLYLSVNLTAAVDDLTHTLPSELALVISAALTGGDDIGILGQQSTHLPPHIVPASMRTSTKYPQKLQRKLDNLYFHNGRFYDPFSDGMLWHLSDYVPLWMKKYFDWHTMEQERLRDTINRLKNDDPSITDTEIWNKLTASGDDETKNALGERPFQFMVMQCIQDQDRKCGGTADRLKIFVYWIQQACENDRLLLIYWTSPGRLEEFMVPPVGGVDWRIPAFLKTILHKREYGVLFVAAKDYVHYPDLSMPMIRLRVQSPTGLGHYYDDRNETESRKRVKTINEPNEFSFANVYHDVFRIFFRPSTAVEQLIHGVLGYPVITHPLQHVTEEPYLLPGYYTGIHVRALHARDTVDPTLAEDISINGLKCGTSLRPGGPFYMASDHKYVIAAAEKFLVSENHSDTKLLVRLDDSFEEDPLHIALDPKLKERKPSDFYDTFVDLWILGMSECLVYNVGGFGTLGLLMGYDPHCSVNQKTLKQGPRVRCNDWVPSNETKAIANNRPYTHLPPLFLDPM